MTFFCTSLDFALKIGLWKSADVMTFFLNFFGFHLILSGKLDIFERDSLFFCSSLDFARKFMLKNKES